MLPLRACSQRFLWLTFATAGQPARGYAPPSAVCAPRMHRRHYGKRAFNSPLDGGPSKGGRVRESLIGCLAPCGCVMQHLIESSTPPVTDETIESPLGLDGLLRHPAAPIVSNSKYPTPNTKAEVRSDANAKLLLPSPSSWKSTFCRQSFDKVLLRNRVSLQNPEIAARLANSFVPAGSKGKVIIEAFPGNSSVTSKFGLCHSIF